MFLVTHTRGYLVHVASPIDNFVKVPTSVRETSRSYFREKDDALEYIRSINMEVLPDIINVGTAENTVTIATDSSDSTKRLVRVDEFILESIEVL